MNSENVRINWNYNGEFICLQEKEREEMLDHYRSLSHDAVMLEGNNQSLEHEAAEYK